MKKTSSDRGSQASVKKEYGFEPLPNQKSELFMIDESDEEEEQPVPPLTSSSENFDNPSPHNEQTSKVSDDIAEAAMTKIQGSAHEGTGTSISSQIQKIIARELSTPAKKGKIDLQSVPLKEYLEQTVIPIVHQGLLALARERPNSPIEYLAAYFLKHKQKYQSDQQTLYTMDQDKSNDNTSPGIVPQSTTNDNLQQGVSETVSTVQS